VNEKFILKTLDKRRISLKRFNDGGAAILAAVSKNHQKVIAGKISIKPFDRKRLREFEDS
jgi:hypothetical protein